MNLTIYPPCIGIDPGTKGAISVYIASNPLEKYETLYTIKLPDTVAETWKVINGLPKRVEYLVDGRMVRSADSIVMIEQQLPRPTRFKDKVTKEAISTVLASTCYLYGNYSMLVGMLVAAGLNNYQCVAPKEWQSALGIRHRGKAETESQWKTRLAMVAKGLFPSEKITKVTADSLLLMEYARKEGLNRGSTIER